ncbi:MAG TPA: DUF3343 domain-containing protein [Longimicrobiales bacterium]|nr:DUF3343 domain-containing protein [Longimicrobiales bacterium]
MTGQTAADARTFVFDTTHHAMWAEDVAREEKVSVDVVPAPPEVEAKCGLAIRTSAGAAARLKEAFDEKGIPYTILE